MDDRRTRGRLRRTLAARILLPLGIVVAAIVVHLVVVGQGKRHEHERADARAGAVASEVQARVRGYGGVLYGVRGLFGASEHVTTTEYHLSHEQRAVMERYASIKAIGFADLLRPSAAARRAREVRREVRASGLPYPRFAIHPRPRPGAARVAPITYMEPQTGNEPAFGLDLFSEPRRRDAARRALVTGDPQATAPLRLIGEPASARGVIVMLSVGDADARTVGIAYEVLRLPALVDEVLGGNDGGADVELYDLGPTAAPGAAIAHTAPMFDSDGERDALRPHEAGHGSHVLRFDVMGRRWALYYAPAHSLAPPTQDLLAWLPLLVGALLAALAAWLLGSSLRTERRAIALAERMTQSLRESQTELARSNAELERFAYVASHDLREPLRTITGFLGLLARRHRDRLDDDGRDFIDLAVAGAKRMDALIAELLEYSRTGRADAPAEPTDLKGAWSVAVRNLSAAIAESDAIVTSGPLPTVLADRGEMVQVLQNLLGNAIKYHGPGAPHVHVGAVRRGDEWEVAVTDDGPGIDPRHHDRIFVLLQRLHRNDEVEGTGIGLAICKKIVERHGGRIWVESAPGAGARFCFTLPAAYPAALPVAA